MPPGVRLPPMIVLCLGLRTALPHGRGDRAPPRKPPSALSSRSPPKATSPWPAPRGGAGSARPQRRPSFRPGDGPVRPPGVRLPPLIMLCPGMGTASQRGRTECVPPRKPPSASSPTFPRTAIHAGLVPPRTGGLRTPVKGTLLAPEDCPH